MTCRSLLWITAAAVAVGAAVSDPSITVAEPLVGWSITLDEPTTETVVESKHLTIQGTASHPAGVDAVTVTVVPHGLPPECGPATGPATIDGDTYLIELDVTCNGPHQIDITAEGPTGSATGEPRAVRVAERPPQPAPPEVDVTSEGGLRATWDPGDDPDATGSILHVDYRQHPFTRGIDEATLPPADRRASIAVRTLRWGADGPGTTITSPESGWTYIAEINPTEPPDDLEPPPESDPELSARTPPPHDPRAPTSTPPPPTTTVTTTVPANPPAEALAPSIVVRPPAPARQPSAHTDERAASTATAPTGGMVRTTDDRSPGLAAPIGIALLLAAAAALTWRRHHRAHHLAAPLQEELAPGISTR